ncbi:phospholipase A2 inhibitor CNF-like [Colossoma macropomum]|uniref:phospholipase A2 inhibitor CNF-like n=1 Tax=Colossoma macropomum TaxID=42526 RepID=UPI001864BB7A|nr:phospholipase A2 inhibitor CNF-like [Colossoma macropomum]
MRTCLPSVFCVTGRINAGFLRATISSKCCKTDLCNDKAVPDHPVVEMKVVLVLVSVFFTKGLALQCYDCTEESAQTCPRKECPYQCNSIAATFSLGGVQEKQNMRTCLPSVVCVTGGINTGFLRGTINSKCCKTDLCNDKALPVLPNQAPNGKKCCTNTNCSETVKCVGDEDRCFNGSVPLGVPFVNKTSLQGCASKSICDGFVSITQQFNITADIKCCEGNLCNTAISINLGLLIMLGSLLTSILFL